MSTIIVSNFRFLKTVFRKGGCCGIKQKWGASVARCALALLALTMHIVINYTCETTAKEREQRMFHERLQAIRKQRGYSQEELARKLHVVRQTVSKWEKGRSVPDADVLVQLSKILEVPVSTLLGENMENADNAKESVQQTDAIARQLAKINAQLAVKNKRARRIWQGILIALSFTALLYLLIAVLFSAPRLEESSEQSVIVENSQQTS